MSGLSWEAIVALGSSVSALIAVVGFWIRLSDRITKADSAAAASTSSAQAASLLATALQLKYESVQRELSDYKAEVARTYVSDKELYNAEQRFATLVEEIKKDIRGVTERLDRVLERSETR